MQTGPSGEVTVTEEPISAVPEMGEPSVAATVGTAGAVWSTVTGVMAETLPAGSVAVTDNTAPAAGTGEMSQLNAPAPVATVVHSTVPLAAFTTTVEPASARPETGLPSVGLTVGAAGATPSVVTVPAVETLPAGSVAVADNTVPPAGTVAGTHDHTPAASAVAVHTGPDGEVTVTVVPASALPEIGLPSVGFIEGAAGAAESTTTVAGEETFPARSVAVTCRVVPFTGTEAGMQDHRPLAEAVAVQTGVPPAVMVMVEPGSAEPEMVVPAVGFTTGTSDAEASTLVEAGSEVLPAGSVAVTVTVAPLAGTGTGSHEKAPLTGLAVVVHSTAPAPSVTVTVEPGSAMPVTGLPSVTFNVGATGATASVTTWVAEDALPAGSTATTDRVVPEAGTGDGVQLKVPSAAATAEHKTVPPPSVMVTVEPGSDMPVTMPPLVGFTVGAVGGVASTTTVAGPDTLPAPLAAVTDRI